LGPVAQYLLFGVFIISTQRTFLELLNERAKTLTPKLINILNKQSSKSTLTQAKVKI